MAVASLEGHEKAVRVLTGSVSWLHGMMNAEADPWCDIAALTTCLREFSPIYMMTHAFPQSFQSAVMNLKTRIGQYGKQRFEQAITSFSEFIGKLGTATVQPESCFTDLNLGVLPDARTQNATETQNSKLQCMCKHELKRRTVQNATANALKLIPIT